jgi:hypothetical protein
MLFLYCPAVKAAVRLANHHRVPWSKFFEVKVRKEKRKTKFPFI